MTLNRVIHTTVRRDLARHEALGAAPNGDRARAPQLEAAYANRHRELKHDQAGEDSQVFPFRATVTGLSEVQVMEGQPSDGRRTCRGGTAMNAYALFPSTIPAPVTFLLSRVAGRSYHREVAPEWRGTT
jgi:hypothetical protein